MPAMFSDRLWLSVDYRPPLHFGPRFHAAQEMRQRLRAEGVKALFLSTHEPLEKIAGNPDDVVFPFEETYPAGGSPRDQVGLRKALEEMGIPFIGGGSRAIEAISDKRWAKETLAGSGIDVPPGIVLEDPERGEEDAERFLAGHRCPAVAKPVSGPGASIGVTYLPGAEELRAFVRSWSRSNGRPLLLEEWLAGPELTAWVLGAEPDIQAVGVFELSKSGEPILDHDMKIGLRTVEVPETPSPEVTPDVLQRAGEAAVACHRTLGAYSYSRADLIVHEGRPVVLELNPHPKFLHHARSGLTAALGRTLGEVMGILAGHARRRPAVS